MKLRSDMEQALDSKLPLGQHRTGPSGARGQLKTQTFSNGRHIGGQDDVVDTMTRLLKDDLLYA